MGEGGGLRPGADALPTFRHTRIRAEAAAATPCWLKGGRLQEGGELRGHVGRVPELRGLPVQRLRWRGGGVAVGEGGLLGHGRGKTQRWRCAWEGPKRRGSRGAALRQGGGAALQLLWGYTTTCLGSGRATCCLGAACGGGRGCGSLRPALLQQRGVGCAAKGGGRARRWRWGWGCSGRSVCGGARPISRQGALRWQALLHQVRGRGRESATNRHIELHRGGLLCGGFGEGVVLPRRDLLLLLLLLLMMMMLMMMVVVICGLWDKRCGGVA